MGILSWIILGLLVGILAKWIMPVKNSSSLVVTAALGIVGALVGGFISSRLGIGTVDDVNISSIALTVVGAILVLFVYIKVQG